MARSNVREVEPREDSVAAVLDRLRAFSEGDEGFVAEMLETYVLSCDRNLSELREQALCRDDLKVVMRLAHSLKGASLNVGAPQLALLAERVERAAEQGAWEEVETGLTTLGERTSRLCRSICADMLRRAA